MALTGLQINKLLPQTNCKECGSNTCLAFAMKLAAKKADLALCSYASEEAKRVLGAAAEAPVRNLTLGPDRSLQVGGETVLYRHEKTFVHQTALAVNLNDTDSEQLVDNTLNGIRDYLLERVGEKLKIDMVSVTQRGDDAAAFVRLAEKAWKVAQRPLVLRGSHAEALARAAQATAGCGGVLAPAAAGMLGPLRESAVKRGFALAVTAPDLDGIIAVTETLKTAGFNDILLNFENSTLAEQFQTKSICRRAAIKDSYRPLGYPFIRFIPPADPVSDTIEAIGEIVKYGGICVLPGLDRAQLASLMTLRLNIFTDPQKPIRVEPRVYAVGDPGPCAPVMVTTNFSLTYFIVSGEIENAGISAWLVVPDCEGMSVLTAWAAGKFSAASIAKFIQEVGLEKTVTRRDIVIPGYVAQISGELEEALPGWKVLVGPKEAADIESFAAARLG